MRQILLTLTIFMLSSSVFAWKMPWTGKKKTEPIQIQEKQPEVPKKQEYCNYSIDVGNGNAFVFKGGCEGFKHIGIIDTKHNKVIVLNRDLEQEYDSNFKDVQARERFIGKAWGDLISVEFGKVK